jgi:hypothetical protein
MNNFLKIGLLIFAYTIIFVIIYFTAFVPIYIEGDDASTILYHIIGRESAIQSPYSPYHSGLDFLLKFISNNETTIRVFSMNITFVFGYLSICLTGYWILKKLNYNYNTLILLILLPLIIPEILFNSLILNPTNISFVFCMLALITSENFAKTRNPYLFFITPLLYLIGIPFRWSMELFFIVPLWSYLYNNRFSFKTLFKDMGYILLTITSIVFSFIGIYISGYSPLDVFDTLIWGKEYSEKQELSIIALFAHNVNFITPALVLLMIVGTYKLFIKVKFNFIWLFVINIIPYIIIGMFPCYKFYMMLTPFLFLITALGFDSISKHKLSKLIIIIVIIAPWLFGIKLKIKDNIYGPGFEMSKWENINPVEFIKNPDKRKNKIEFASISNEGGMVLSTMEGPRPLFGIGDVLLLGKWKKFNTMIEKEREYIVNMAIDYNRSIIQDRETNYSQCILYRNNYITGSKFISYNDSIKYRVFVNNINDTIKIFIPRFKQDKDLVGFFERQDFNDFVILSSYSTILNSNKSVFLKRVGPFTASYSK